MNNLTQVAIYFTALIALAVPLGRYMARIFEGDIPFFMKWMLPIEKIVYRICGIDEREEMNWKGYAISMMLFNAAGFLAVYALQRLQNHLPFNPMAMGPVTPDSSFNTAISFATNTNWQGYGGESTMSYLTQMAALGVQNFVSAAAGMACLLPLIRAFVRKETKSIGNFWVDMVRITAYILAPLSLILALVLTSQGVVQTFRPSATVQLLQTAQDASQKPVTEQTLAVGPAASQIAIKQLGTNGGGYFNVNSAHPFENPTPFANFLESLSILLIGAALCFSFGTMIKDRRQGWALFTAMTVLFIPFLWLCVASEQSGNPALNKMGVAASAIHESPLQQSGGNMEGKEVRYGIAQSAIWAAATTAASNGSVNSMHDSNTPLGGLAPMILIQLGEIVYGGVGSGLYGMLLFVIVAVFIAGLMVGRTPEYMGKKIEAYEMKMATIGILVPCGVVLIGTAIAAVSKAGVAGIANSGAHGFSEILYAFSSAGNNNGSAFAGLSASTPFYNTMLGLAMFFARYWIAIPVLAIAGSLAKKKMIPASAGTLPTHTPLFIAFLVSTVIIVGALTFIPALALGPIVEHLMMIGA